MRVISKKTIDFPSLNWGITKGETKDLPEGKEEQELILQSPHIQKATSGSKKDEDKKAEEDK